MSKPLTRESVRDRLGALRRERQTREQVARWARRWLQHNEPIGDPLLLKMVVYLAAADLQGFTRPYLYGPADFEAWESELRWNTPTLEAPAWQQPLEG